MMISEAGAAGRSLGDVGYAPTGQYSAARSMSISSVVDSPFATAAELYQRVLQLTQRCESLSIRVLGHTPEATDQTKGALRGGETVSPPVFSALGDMARDGIHRIAAAEDALNRIERSLP